MNSEVQSGARPPLVAVVGCGYWGKNLVRNFYELGSLKAICDVDETRLTGIRAAYPVEVFSSYRELLSRDDIPAVAIAAPAAQHADLAHRALEAGKDVFVEKPLALSAGEGKLLVDLARRQNRILMVGHLLQYHPAILELKRLIDSGEMGRLQYIYSSRLNLGKLRSEENILWSFAPHDVSAILFLLGEAPTRAAAHGGSYLNPKVTDITVTNFDFASGVKAHIFVSWLHPFKEQKLIIAADRQMAVFDDTETHQRKLVVYPHRIDWVDRIPVARKAEGTLVPLDSTEPLSIECGHFLECVLRRQQPRTDGEEALRVLRVLEACEKSLMAQGEPMRVEASPRAYFAHPTAVIDEPVEIGEGTRIWHFSHIMSKSKIGQNCNLGQNVVVSSGCRLGNNVKVQNNVSIYAGVELEDDVFCGPSMVFTNVINPRSHVSRRHQYQHTLVKRGASLGANCTIVCGSTIGQYAFVAAGAVVTRDVADFALVMGVPARQVGWMCNCGSRLEGNTTILTCHECRREYQLSDGHLQMIGAAARVPSLPS